MFSTPTTPMRSLKISFSRITAAASSAKLRGPLPPPIDLASTATALGSTALTRRTSPMGETCAICSSMYGSPANIRTGSPSTGTTTAESTMRSWFAHPVR